MIVCKSVADIAPSNAQPQQRIRLEVLGIEERLLKLLQDPPTIDQIYKRETIGLGGGVCSETTVPK